MSAWNTLITVEELATAIDHCIVIDCRHDLFDPEAGRNAYAESHIPSARFLHLDEDLSGPRNGTNGRHPWPDRAAFIARMAALGISDDTQVVAYDAQGGQMAGRLWALLRWIGHERVAVLDGNLLAWQQAGFPMTAEVPAPRAAGRLSANRPAGVELVDAATVLAALGHGTLTLIDARAPDRFSGLIEQVDSVAGHIPGALNRFYGRNLRPDDQRFKPAEVLEQEFSALLGQVPAEQVVHQCGSGVTACHNLLAMTHAGIPGSRLYPGSWSEWISDPARPVAKATGPAA